ncbi:NADP-dependent oxidoreductase [Nonomuraea sp. NPDC049784]|uniref:NADP-dependent oxidoreductase n=1 Tax=Nonomuraea sp. NPDC049784 TaxID=3154361 RepID=UPI003407EED8
MLQLETVTRPMPRRNEVLVKVRAAGVNPPDWKVRRTPFPPHFVEPPLIPGWDVSGVVEEIGEYVGRFKPGDEVFGMVDFPYPAGAYAEYVVARPRHLARKPAGIDHVQAAALPMPALTAWQAFSDIVEISPGQRVLVHAAAGGVGHLAVQLAKLRGAYVIGTTRASKHDFVRGLGADEVIDYTSVDFSEVLSDVDIVLDMVGLMARGQEYPLRSLRVLRPGGMFIAGSGMTPADAAAFDQAGVRRGQFSVEPDHAALAEIAALAADGKLAAHVDRVFPLADAAKAHAVMESGDFVGKLVLTVS